MDDDAKKPSKFDLEAFNRDFAEKRPVTSKWVDLTAQSVKHPYIRRFSAIDPHAGSIKALEMITTFLEYHEKGEVPPKLVMDDLYSRFKEYYLDNLAGKKNAELGRYFDDKNRSGMFWRHILYPELIVRCSDVAELVVFFGVSRERACGIVGSKLKDFVLEKYNPLGKGEANIPGPESLLKFYRKRPGLEEVSRRDQLTDSAKLHLLERYEDYLGEEQRLIGELATLRRSVQYERDKFVEAFNRAEEDGNLEEFVRKTLPIDPPSNDPDEK